MHFSLAEHSGLLLLAGSVVMTYLATHVALESLGQRTAAAPPDGRGLCVGRVVLGHFLTIAAVALVAAWQREGAIAVAVIFGTAVAAVTLPTGTALLANPIRQELSEHELRNWAFLLPVAAMALIGGFAGRVTWILAALLAAQGAVLLDLGGILRSPRAALSDKNEIDIKPMRRALAALLAVALAGVGAWGALRGVHAVSEQTPFTSVVTAAITLGPLLVLPMVGFASNLAQQDRTHEATSAAVGIALLNLCLLLPLTVAVWHGRPWIEQYLPNWAPPSAQAPTTGPATTTAPAADVEIEIDSFSDPRLPYPLATWRVDAVALVLIGLALMPVAMGRWTLGWQEGAFLLLGYAAYMVLSARLGFR